jgi:hypothetical protein
MSPLSGLGGDETASRGNDVDLPPHQIGRHFRQPIVLVLRPLIVDCKILAFDIPSLAQTLAECVEQSRGVGRLRRAGQIADNRR